MTEEDQKELKALDELSKSLDDEEAMLNDQMVRTQSELEDATADDIATITQASSELDSLKDKAEEEENQGQISDVKETINQIQSILNLSKMSRKNSSAHFNY